MDDKQPPLIITTDGIPHREGVGDRELTVDDGPIYHAARVSKAANLKDLDDEYAFYSHALLFTHGRWGKDPVADYIYKENPKCQAFAMQLPQAPFRGLAVEGNPSWNYIIFAVSRKHWDGLRAFIGSLSGIDRKAKRYHRVVAQQLPMADILALEKLTMIPDPVPTIMVTLFALEGNWATIGYEPAKRPPMDRITVIKRAPVADVVKLHQAIFKELEKPFQIIEPTLAEAERKAYEELSRGKRKPD